MIINDNSKRSEITEAIEYTLISRDGTIKTTAENMLVEHVIDVYINEILTMKLICMPDHLPELVLGRLVTEGIIKTRDDVKLLCICEDGKRVEVTLKDEKRNIGIRRSIEKTPTTGTGNRILNDYFVGKKELDKVNPINWKTEWIFSLADTFSADTKVHKKTAATHSCFLASEDKILFSCEDIGRHNALDKVIGYAVIHNLDLTKCIVYSSGRLPTDMVEKVIRAGIPVLASKASATIEAQELARDYDLTLISVARSDTMKLLAGRIPE